MDSNRTPHEDLWVEKQLAALDPGKGWQPNSDAGMAELKAKQASKGSAGRRWAWTAAIATTVCFCLLVFPSPRVLAHWCVECSLAVWQAFAPRQAQADLKPEAARGAAPDFSLADESGKEIKLSGLKGKVVLVNFWATWCEGCQVEIPWLIEFEKKYKRQGLTVIGVSMDDDGWKAVRPWLKESKVNYPIVIGNENLAKQYGLEGMPLTAFVDRGGKVADAHSGLLDRSAAEQKIRALLQESAKKPTE